MFLIHTGGLDSDQPLFSFDPLHRLDSVTHNINYDLLNLYHISQYAR